MSMVYALHPIGSSDHSCSQAEPYLLYLLPYDAYNILSKLDADLLALLSQQGRCGVFLSVVLIMCSCLNPFTGNA
jgi:hypothetical protein